MPFGVRRCYRLGLKTQSACVMTEWHFRLPNFPLSVWVPRAQRGPWAIWRVQKHQTQVSRKQMPQPPKRAGRWAPPFSLVACEERPVSIMCVNLFLAARKHLLLAKQGASVRGVGRPASSTHLTVGRGEGPPKRKPTDPPRTFAKSQTHPPTVRLFFPLTFFLVRMSTIGFLRGCV
jgi:hypothetical protein